MGSFTFEGGFSLHSSAYDRAHRHKPNPYALPIAKPGQKTSSLEKLKRGASKAFSKSGNSLFHHKGRSAKSGRPTSAKESLFFQLPLAVREKIYGYAIGRGELLHVLLRYRSSPPRYEVAYRRCGAGGNVQDCVLKNCREFHDLVKGSYYGYFDHVGGLFRSCRDIYKEASNVLYSQNTLEFDHPLSLVIFSKGVPRSSFQSIRSISIDLQRNIYVYGANNFSLCTSLHPDQWIQMWEIISTIESLEEIRVRFQLLIDGWMGWTEKEVFEPLRKVKQPLKVFEVEMLTSPTVASADRVDEKDVPFKLIKF